MNTARRLEQTATYLQAVQLAGGGFESVSLPTKYAKQGDRIYRTTFFPSLILQALASVRITSLESVKKQLVNFLTEQKSGAWSFNYWDRQSNEYKTKPHPDDLDDTFCALAALQSEQPDIFTPSALASIAKLLIAAEKQEGGPYKTWLTTSPNLDWHDVDVAVNANIGNFLARQDVELPSVMGLIETAIAKNQLKSPYYPNIYSHIYFIARWYQGEYQERLISMLLTRKKGAAWQSAQRTAMAITSLLKLGYDYRQLASSVEYLFHLQQPDGSWETEAFCVDPSVENGVRYGCSRALSTALCLEAITLYEERARVSRAVSKSKTASSQFYRSVMTSVEKCINRVERTELKEGLRKILAQIKTQDADSQIVLLPQIVAQSFEYDISSQVLGRLARISLWGWMAYTTYDDFLDGEGEVRLLPAANVCLRYLVEELITVLPESVAFHKEADHVMERLDAANAWELVNCRGQVSGHILHIEQIPDYGDYWQLADRSLGHTISALGVIYASDTLTKAPVLKALRDFMYHYLIARQLNDDAHDWYDDLLQGHINAVSAVLLRSMHPVVPKGGLKIDVVAKKAALQKLLWEEVIDYVCEDIEHHIGLAREALQEHGLAVNTETFEKLLQPIEKASTLALAKRNEALEFIAAL